jgi:two-component system, cell cycle sensor histidine kinase and response regulator CckA
MNIPKIIIVEDENIVALDIKKHLERTGYQVIGVVSTAKDLVDRLEIELPDLVLMDIKLKGEVNGLDLAESVKQTYDIPVVILTAFSDDETIERAKFSQAYGYIVKPFDDNELKSVIKFALYRYEMENMLKEREQLFSTTFSSIDDAVIVSDENDIIQYVNPKAQELFGGEDKKIEGRQAVEVFTFTPPDQQSNVDPASPYPISLYFKNEQKIYLEVRKSPLRYEHSHKNGSVRVFHNITERIESEMALKANEIQLRQAQKMDAIGRLSGGIAHDFNNILTVILGYTKLMLEDLEPDSNLRTYIEGIEIAAKRNAVLTKKLLVFSRQQNLEVKTLELNDLVLDIEEMLRRFIQDSISFDLFLHAKPSTVKVDQNQMEQVIINLVLNARDAMPDGGRLFISSENRTVDRPISSPESDIPTGEYVILTVMDTGLGINPEEIDKIFEPFYTTKSSGDGIGLGLSTAYGIVQQSGGYITVSSRSSTGTRFEIFLPRDSDNTIQ